MAEIIFKSAGVSTKEIDLSGPTGLSPSGVPAGIIGTANAGPAFVPLTLADYAQFVATFGASDGEKFGPLAAREWLANASSLTYLRVLGVGDGKKKSTTGANAGKVTNAGFVVGAKLPQADGLLGPNAKAGATGEVPVAAILADAIDLDSVADGNSFTLTVPVAAGGDGVAHIFLFDTTNNINSNEVATTYGFSTSLGGGVSDADLAQDLVDAINQVANGGVKYGATDIGSNSTGVDLGITATLDGTKVTLTMDTVGPSGNVTSGLTAIGGFGTQTLLKTNSSFTGGEEGHEGFLGRTYFLGALMRDNQDSGYLAKAGIKNVTANVTDGAAHPIIRGVVLAPSGVILSLSSSRAPHNSPFDDKAAAGAWDSIANEGDGGHPFGAIENVSTTQDFVILLNGHKANASCPNSIAVSMDPQQDHYFAKTLNTDPTLIEKKGHLLYANWDVYSTWAVPSSVGFQTAAARTEFSGKSLHEAAFLLSSSLGRNAGSTTIPNFENFEDRFGHASSPYVVSQKFGGKNVNLFKVHALDDGASANKRFKISIKNIKASNNINNKFGSFSLIVRGWDDNDDEVVQLEEYHNLNLNPTDARFVSKIIGDMNIYYDFDKKEGAQKLVVEGSHSNASAFIRVEVPAAIKSGDHEDEALPVGFRGAPHLVTSGSGILSPGVADADRTDFLAPFDTLSNIAGLVTQAPIPMRRNISTGKDDDNTTKVNAKLHWGTQFERRESVSQPNLGKQSNPGTVEPFTTYFPSFHTSYRGVVVSDNEGITDSSGTVLDADRFNNNLFSLEKVQIIKLSHDDANLADIPDHEEWARATYQRDGVLADTLTLTNTDTTTTATRFLDVTKDFVEATALDYLKFSFFVQGGFDGVNIHNTDEANMTDTAAYREALDTAQSGVADNVIASFRKAIDVMEEKADVGIKLLAIPGMRETKITDHAVDAVENRFDAMLIMDLEEFDELGQRVTGSVSADGEIVKVHVGNTAKEMSNRNIDSSFAATYFPDTYITDPHTSTNVQCPPSVSVLGAFALNDAVAHPWFAPAGFTRGALATSIETHVKLSKGNMDTLYDQDINPITSFPDSQGVVVFGQKTLLAAQNSLDRVNVRRLLIEIRRQVKAIGNTILFEPNRAEVLARFSGRVQPILARIQAQQGLDRFRVQIDTSTTTQADVENNTIRGKVFLQPTRSVEFIALDFVVTNAGSGI